MSLAHSVLFLALARAALAEIVPVVYPASSNITTKTEVATANDVSSWMSLAFQSTIDVAELDAVVANGTALQDAINTLYGLVFASKDYDETIEPLVNASTTFDELCTSLAPLLREPTEIYSDGGTQPAHFDASGCFVVEDTMTHFLPGTTGTSEAGALRDVVVQVLREELGADTPMPTLEAMLGAGDMADVLLPLPASGTGGNWQMANLTAIELSFRYSAGTATNDTVDPATAGATPTASFWTTGSLVDPTFNIQDCKGAFFSLAGQVDATPADGDVLDVMANATSVQATTSVSNTTAVQAVLTLTALDDSGASTVSSFDGLAALAATSSLPVMNGVPLGGAELNVFPTFQLLPIAPSAGRSSASSTSQFVLAKAALHFVDSGAAETVYLFDAASDLRAV